MEFTMSELSVEQGELLPGREALGAFNWAGIVANNTALALNAVTFQSAATAVAAQVITVNQ